MIADTVFASWVENGMQVGHMSLTGQMCREGFILRLMELLDVRLGGDRNGVVAKAQGNVWQQEWAGLPVAQTVLEECPANLGTAMRGDCQCQSK
jgi:hypothetical protein